LAIGILAACEPTGQPAPTTAGDEIAIASDFPLQGQYASPGSTSTEGVRFAIERHPTIGKFKLTFKPFDDNLAGLQDPAKGIQNVLQMAADPQILAIVGPYTSIMAAAEIPVASQNHLAMVSPATTSDCLTLSLPGCQPPAHPGGSNNFFRITAPDSAQGTAMADFVANSLSIRKVVVLSDGYPYGDHLASSFVKELSALGGTVVFRDQFRSSANNFTDLLSRMKADGGQALYIGGVGAEGVCRIRAPMRAILPDAYFLGGDGLVDSTCVKDAEAGANDRMIATVAGNPSLGADPASKKVIGDYKNRHRPDQLGAYTFAAYDCALILIEAIRRAIDANGGQLPSRQQVIEAVAATHLKGITGTWSFDAKGDATAPGISFFRVDAGSWTFWKAVTLGPQAS
jgi:branched-chain amino acid transport system substrate-binding protein